MISSGEFPLCRSVAAQQLITAPGRLGSDAPLLFSRRPGVNFLHSFLSLIIFICLNPGFLQRPSSGLVLASGLFVSTLFVSSVCDSGKVQPCRRVLLHT